VHISSIILYFQYSVATRLLVTGEFTFHIKTMNFSQRKWSEVEYWSCTCQFLCRKWADLGYLIDLPTPLHTKLEHWTVQCISVLLSDWKGNDLRNLVDLTINVSSTDWAHMNRSFTELYNNIVLSSQFSCWDYMLACIRPRH